ncbi:DUF423 domain-containing protein [Acuticoccus mangrovi]|uniref:DUF423 domain-containing protein n=1 Tax=Acuticoccus mangrovi TaxID=2796142 RepID=A0A934INA9_9HYPH|nr:DUF423 domain-containing protein [Acuticoccus mangrovi]MBJ3775035.1 DUF423 domain-containing protein [Acuticoccus mangrovi]
MRVVLVGALNGAVAVAVGAIGAHLLEGRPGAANPELIQTAVMYQLFHAATMVGMGALKGHVLPAMLGAASWAFAIGIVLFSGSLYALSLGAPHEVAYVTPVGGGLLIIGWLLLSVAAARRV